MKIHPFWSGGSALGTQQINPRVFPQAIWCSNSQTVTAFGATSANDGTTTTGCHTNEEAVSTLAANNRWLISAFHD
jgi:hypothetical protein